MKTHVLVCALAVAAALIQTAFAAATPAPIPTVEVTTAATAESKTKVLEAFEVTGSRIKRLDDETPAPVVTFTAVDIELSGFTTVGESSRASRSTATRRIPS